MAGYFSTGQSPQRAVVLMEEEEEEEEEGGGGGGKEKEEEDVGMTGRKKCVDYIGSTVLRNVGTIL
jgi:hypothetical protein